MTTKIDRVLATLETKPHHGHARHHASPRHHRGVLILGIVVALGLLVLLIVDRPRPAAPAPFKAPTRSVQSEAAITRDGVANDFSSVSTTDLNDSLLQP